MNAYSNKNTGKLLVAVLAMAMIVAGAAVVLSDEVNAANEEAQINDQAYPTLADAISAVKPGETIELLKDVTVSSSITVNGFNIDGNDYTIDLGTNSVSARGDSTISNVTLNKTDNHSTIAVVANSSIELNNVKFTGASTTAVYVNFGQTTNVVLNDCTISDSVMKEVILSLKNNADGYVEINNAVGLRVNVADATAASAITLGDELVLNNSPVDRLNIDANASLTIPAGESLIVDLVRGAGNLSIEEGGYFAAATNEMAADNITNENPTMGISDSTVVFADDQVTFAGDLYLAGNLTIPEGKTLVFANGSSLNLNGKTLTVEGTLSIENGANIIGVGGESEMIVITSTGTIQNEGVIGYLSEVSVTAQNATGKVTMMNVEGISFGIETVWKGNTSTSTLTVSGDVYATSGSMTTYSISIDNAKIVGDMSIDDEVAFTSNEAVVTDGATLTMDGTMTGTGLNMTDGSTVIINGDAAGVPVNAETGKYVTSSANIAGFKYAVAQITLGNVAGVTLTVNSTSYTEDKTNWTEQVLYISGSTALVDDAAAGTITFDNTDKGAYKATADATETTAFDAIAVVAADAELVLDEKTVLDGSGLVVLGEVQYPASGNDKSDVTNFVGTEYFIKESASVTTGYITSFDAALAAIDTADNKTITVYGQFEVETGFDLNDGQTVALAKSGNGAIAAVMDIGTDAEVNVNKGAKITGTVNEVEGILFVQKGATVAKPNMYAVSGTNKETGDVTYAGFEAAIRNSAAGDVITVVAQGYDAATGITVENAIEIPADRTVVIDNGKKIVFEKNLTIAEGATLTNKGTVEMAGEKAVITDNGTFDNTAGTVNFTQTGGNVNIAGQYIISDATKLPASGANYAVNGAYYADKGKIVVTTFAKAATAVGEMQGIQTVTVIGKITESGDVTLTQDNVLITGEATLGTVTINNTTLTVQSGSLTATVAGTYGADGSTSSASVSLSKTENIVVENYSGVDSMNVTTWYTSINGVSGVVAVTSGEIVYDAASMTLSEANSMKVNSGATLVIPEETTNLTISGQYLDIEGTLAVEGAVSLGGMTVEGTIDVTGSLTVTDGSELIVLGTINVSADEEENATFTVLGTLVLGEKPEILGTSTTGTVTGAIVITSGVIEIYDGASVADATITNSAEVAIDPTTLVVNGYDYITVYTDVSTTIASYNSDILALKDVKDVQDIVWYAEGEELGADAKIGDYAEVTTEVAWATADITISIGSRISLSIDGVIVDTYNGRTYPLTIGTHNVVAIIDPGYTGDVTITFNGQAVGEDGTITVTSDMIDAGVVLSVMGQLSQDVPVISGGDSDDGLGLTDYLLIILVVLIVIMAIMVAMRLMRS